MVDESRLRHLNVLRGPDLNREPPGYEPSELPLLYPAISNPVKSKKSIKSIKPQLTLRTFDFTDFMNWCEQVNGIEPSSRPWQGRIITIILHLRFTPAPQLRNGAML